MKRLLCIVLFAGNALATVRGQDPAQLIQKLKSKLDRVDSYIAQGVMKTDVAFLKVPQARVTIFYKRPGKFRIKNENGISLVPKSVINVSLPGLLQGNFTAIDAGTQLEGGKTLRIIKLLPVEDNQDIVLSTLYIDQSLLLIMKSRTTTRENGTYEISLTYGQYAGYGLPDKVICSFNTKDYKLPKGITFDYDDGSRKAEEEKVPNTTGKVEILYASYSINKPVPDSDF